MTQQPCSNCANLQAVIARLLIQIAVLERIIASAHSECLTLVNEADRTLSGHVARGVWAHASGQKKAALRVLRRLEN